MFKSRWYKTATRLPILVVAAGLSACGGGGGGATGPAEDVIHNVTVRFDSVTVMGSCDHNSVFESAGDGEFEFFVQVMSSGSGYTNSQAGTYKEGVHPLHTSWKTTFPRNTSRNENFTVSFQASEKDGLLGKDPSMSDKSDEITHKWDGARWSGARQIQLVTGSASACGVRLRYTITSSPAS